MDGLRNLSEIEIKEESLDEALERLHKRFSKSHDIFYSDLSDICGEALKEIKGLRKERDKRILVLEAEMERMKKTDVPIL